MISPFYEKLARLVGIRYLQVVLL